MIRRFIKKPIPVEVMQYTGTVENLVDLENWSNKIVSLDCFISDPIDCDPYFTIQIKTLEGVMRPSVGDYVVKGPAGEFWFVRKGIFEHTYEEFNE
jgi:hypothetical protein